MNVGKGVRIGTEKEMHSKDLFGSCSSSSGGRCRQGDFNLFDQPRPGQTLMRLGFRF